MTTLLMLAPGTRLNHRYEIVRLLGGGGFSQIFEVRDGEDMKVLKVLDLNEFSPAQQRKAIELFRREASFLSQFRHRGVPQVEPDGYFVWQCDHHAPLHCLVMEKIPGINLQEWLQQAQTEGQRLSARQAIDWLHQLVEILIPLHQQQFFHRDIKPSNIMLRPDGQLMLIDFGTVREVSVTYLVKQEQQDTGTAIISAGYTPPEQAEGQAVPQSDFFALGRTLVTLLTGKPPIDLPVDPQTGQLQWRNLAEAHSPGTRLSGTRLSGTRLPETLPPQVADLIDRLMAPFPGQRPQSGEIILQTIRQIERKLHWEQRLPVLRQVDRVKTKLDRRLLKLTPFKAALLVGLLFGSFMVWDKREDISDQFTTWGLDAREAEAYDRAWWSYQIALLFDRRNAATLFNLGDLYEALQRSDQAGFAYQAALSSNPQDHEDLISKIYNNMARQLIRRDSYEQGITLIETGLKYAETPESKYSLFKNLGWAQLGLKQYTEAQKALENAIQIDAKEGAAYCLIGQVYEKRNQPMKALAAYKQCVLISRPDSDEIQWINRARASVDRLANQPPGLEIQP